MSRYEWMSKTRRTPYTSVKFLTGSASHLAEVTTPKTPQPYLVQADSVVPYESPKLRPPLPMPKPQNKGAMFKRGREWVTIGKWDPFKLEEHIKKQKAGLRNIQNADGLQMAVDYIAALQYRLEHMHD